MAIDRKDFDSLSSAVNKLFKEVFSVIPEKHRKMLESLLIGPVLDEMRSLIGNSRPPIIFLIGRSGHGKSSLINALSNRKVAEVGHIEPTTRKAIPYFIQFPEYRASWSIIDSRGLFETPDLSNGADFQTAYEQLKNDLSTYRPDVMMYVLSASEIRNLEKDVEVFKEIQGRLRKEMGYIPPTVVVLNKVDVLGSPRDWPPENSAHKSGLIKEALDYMTKKILNLEYIPIDHRMPIKGYRIKNSDEYIAVIPVCSLWGETWNMETLAEFIGESLPENAKLEFYQALRNKHLLKKLSTSIIKKFALIAGTIGTYPIPIPDMAVITPLQVIMILIIAGLSCRRPNMRAFAEFMGAIGVNVGGAVLFRTIARQLVKLVPGFGSAVSGGIAYTGTYTLGKAAEAYFFDGIVKKPGEFVKEAEDNQKSDK